MIHRFWAEELHFFLGREKATISECVKLVIVVTLEDNDLIYMDYIAEQRGANLNADCYGCKMHRRLRGD